PVLRLSEASGMDLAETSDLVTDSMSAMGVTIDELSDYLNVCAQASTASNQDINDMATAMIRAGGAARAAGMDYKDTATALGILANNGVKGAKAGTALNAMLVRITTNSEAAKAFDELGVSVYTDTGEMRGLQEILVDTANAMDGMSDAERNAYSESIAGSNYFSKFQYLLEGVTQAVGEDASAWDELYGELNNCEGALDQMAETKNDTLTGDMARLTSVASDLGIEISKGINGNLREMAQLGTDAMTQLDQAFKEGGFSGMLEEVGNIIPQVVETVGSYIPQFIGMGQQFILSLIQGIGQSAPQIATVAVQSITTFVQGAAQMLPAIATTGIQVILNFVQGIIPQLPMIFQTATNGIVQFIQGISANLPAIIQTGIQLIISLIQGILTSLPQIIAAGFQLVGELINTILHTNWIEVGGEILSSIGKGLLGGIGSIGSSIVNGVKGLFGGGATDVSDEGAEAADTFAAGIEASSGVVDSAVSDLTATAFMDMDFTSITSAGMDGTEAFSTGLLDNLPIITSAGEDMTSELTGAFDTGWADINSGATVAMSEMTSTLTTESQTAANAVKNAFEGMTITIPKPKIPVITTSYRTETYGDGGSIQIPQFSVSWNKLGGIFDDPTIFNTAQGLQGVGEAGPEAVLPLDTLWDKMEDVLTNVFRGDNGSVIDSLLAKLDSASNNQQPEFAGAGGAINYAPVYNLYGTASKEDAIEAEKISQGEFEKMMERYERQQRRTRF
ncbi:MAG: phage tail tape measure protein, partial [Bacteroidales bacterium]|nr:phage tail tape measure protein [Bacteroidales bacterium]